jgi:hypothetical protein
VARCHDDAAGVPAGRFISQNVVRDCPIGTFRSTYLPPTDEAARYCNPCPQGITTAAPRSTGFHACTGEALQAMPPSLMFPQALRSSDSIQGMAANTKQLSSCCFFECFAVGQPGYLLTQDNLLPQQTPDGGPSPDLCPRGTFFPGGQLPSSGSTCVRCPLGSDTEAPGATSAAQCSEYHSVLCGGEARSCSCARDALCMSALGCMLQHVAACCLVHIICGTHTHTHTDHSS